MKVIFGATDESIQIEVGTSGHNEEAHSDNKSVDTSDQARNSKVGWFIEVKTDSFEVIGKFSILIK